MKTSIKQGRETREKIMEYLKQTQGIYSPVSYDEIARHTGLPSPSVVKYHLDLLEEMGKIERIGNRQIKVKK